MENSSTEQKDLSAYQAPESELLDQQNSDNATQFFPVSLTKLTVMYIFTLGMYGLVWFYHNWKLQAPSIDKKIYPVWRAIFSIFFANSLFERVHKKSQEIGLADWSHQALAAIYVVFIVLSNLSDRILDKVESLQGVASFTFLLFLVALYPLYQVQKRINAVNNDPDGALNSQFTAVNILFIVLGVLWWGLIIVGTIFLATGEVQ